MSDDRELVQRLAAIDATPRSAWVAELRADLDAAWETGDTGNLDSLRTRSGNVDYIDTEPAPTEPPTNRHRWLRVTAAAATVAVIAGGLVLAARDDDETAVVSDPAPATLEGPVTTPLPPSADELAAVEGAGTRVGFIGLPPQGATPSTPESGELVMSIGSCHEPTGELDDFARLPPLAELYVFADGRMIWQKYEDLPEGANRLSTGLLEQRLTPEGVELMRSEATAAVSSGEPQHCGPDGYYNVHHVFAGDDDQQSLSDDDEHVARIIDPWSWLPESAWEDREIKAYVPSEYGVLLYSDGGGRGPGLARSELELLAAQLPAAAEELVLAKQWEPQGEPGVWQVFYTRGGNFTTDEARTLVAALEEAGFVLEEPATSFGYHPATESEGSPRLATIEFHPILPHRFGLGLHD